MEVRLEQVGKRFNRQWLYKDISATIPALSSCALTGINGSGKSTLLQIIYQYVVPSRGKALLINNGKEMSPQELPAQISFVAPYLELPEELTTMEMLTFHFSLKNKPAHSFDEILRSCGLAGNEHKQVKYFSSGMKQRLKLALAFYEETPLLLMDEPCSNLDQQGIDWYRGMALDMLGKRTMIIASNQPYEYDFCQQIIAVNS